MRIGQLQNLSSRGVLVINTTTARSESNNSIETPETSSYDNTPTIFQIDSSTSNNSINQLSQQSNLCKKCLEEGFQEQATCFCEDCRELGQPEEMYCSYHGTRHGKSHQHVVKPFQLFNNSSGYGSGFWSTASSYHSSSMSSLPHSSSFGSMNSPMLGNFEPSNLHPQHPNILPFCNEHNIHINTYCRTCEQLICSACALSKAHKGHTFELIQDIEQQERNEITDGLEMVSKDISDWEDAFQTSDKELEKACKRIKKVRRALSEKVIDVVEELKKKLDEHARIIRHNIENICEDHLNVITNIKDSKKEIEDVMSQFDQMDEMNGFQVLEKKLTMYNSLFKMCEKMKTDFKYESTKQLYDMKIEVDETSVRATCSQIEQLSKVIKIDPIPEAVDKTILKIQKPKRNATSLDNIQTVGYIGKNMNSTSTFLSSLQLSSSDSCFKCPTDVKISYRHSSIVVSDWGNRKIQIFDSFSRNLKYSFTTPSAPRNIAIDPNFTEFLSIVVSASDNYVYKYCIIPKKDGYEHTVQWVSGKDSSNQFKYPRGIAIEKAIRNTDNNYQIFVCDHGNHRVLVLNSLDGSVIRSIGETNDQVKFKRPWGISLFKGDCLAVTEKKGNRVQIITKDGEVEKVLSFDNNIKLHKPRGIFIDPYSHNLLIVDGSNHRILLCSGESGEVLGSFGSFGNFQNQFNEPHGITFDENMQQILVADCNNNCIHILGKKL